MLASSIFFGSSVISWQFLISYNKLWIGVYLSIITSLIQFLYYINSDSQGSIVLAEARLAGYSFYAIISLFVVCYILKIRKYLI